MHSCSFVSTTSLSKGWYYLSIDWPLLVPDCDPAAGSDVPLAADDNLVCYLHQQRGDPHRVVEIGWNIEDHLHSVKESHDWGLHLAWILKINGMYVCFCCPKELCIVNSLKRQHCVSVFPHLHIIAGHSHVNVMPGLEQLALTGPGCWVKLLGITWEWLLSSCTHCHTLARWGGSAELLSTSNTRFHPGYGCGHPLPACGPESSVSTRSCSLSFSRSPIQFIQALR